MAFSNATGIYKLSLKFIGSVLKPCCFKHVYQCFTSQIISSEMAWEEIIHPVQVLVQTHIAQPMKLDSTDQTSEELTK